MEKKKSSASGSRNNVGSQPTHNQKEPGKESGKATSMSNLNSRFSETEEKEIDDQIKEIFRNTGTTENKRNTENTKNIAHDILNYSLDKIDMPYMLLSVIGDSTEFQPKEWSKLSFQTAVLETINRAEECLVLYAKPGLGNTIGTILENTLKTHSIENDRFLTYRCIRTDEDTIANLNDTGLCLYSHTLMSVCDLRRQSEKPPENEQGTNSGKTPSRKESNQNSKSSGPEQKPTNDEIRTNTMIALEEYIHEVKIEIDFVKEVDNVPVVLVLAEGDMTSVYHVSKAVKENTVVYIIQGSGKAADVIADYLKDANSLEETVARNFGLAFLTKNPKKKYDVLKEHLAKIAECKKMITIFDIEREEPKKLADMISDSVSSLWTISFSDFEDGYIWIPKIYLPLAYRYIQFHRKFESRKASSLLQRAFNVSTNIVRRLLEDGTSLRKIYEHEDTYVYSSTVENGPTKAVLKEVGNRAASNPNGEDKVNIYRQRLHYLRNHCRELVGYNTVKELFSGTSPEIVSRGYMTEEQLAELFMFEFILSNDHEMADIFWHRCPNQLMTALVMSAFLKKKANVEYKEIKRRLGADLMNMSESFEARAKYILDRMYDTNERDETQVNDDNEEFLTEEIFTEEPLDEEFRILTDKVDVMGLECTPLEFAFNNERLDFLSHSTCQRYLHTIWTSRNKKVRSKFGCIRKHMVAPRTRFYVNYFFFLLAIICCSVFILTDVRLINSFSEISKYQIAFTIWILGDFFEEFIVEFFLDKFKSQVQSTFFRIKNWMRDLWNWLDMGCYISYGFGVFSHFLSTDPEMKITRRLYTITVVFMYLRFLRIMLMSRHIGTKVIMIAYMTKDLRNFFPILAIVIFGVGVGYHANIYPNFSPLFYDDWGDRWTDARIFSIIAMPYWQIYGDPMLDQLHDDAISYCQSKNITSDCNMDFSVPLTSFLFMMFGNILLLNLVIAMFSNRFEEVERNSEKVWNFRYMSIVLEYRTRLPSPINFIIRPLQILFYPFQNNTLFRTRKIGIIENNYLITRKEFKYQNVTPDGIDNTTSTFQFRVKTDGDIYVGLFGYLPDKKEGEMIEIFIHRNYLNHLKGDNSNYPVVTNKKKDILVTKDTESILNKSEFMEFEISWKTSTPSKTKMSVYSRTYIKDKEKDFCLHRKLIMTASCLFVDINCISYHTSDQSAGVWKFCNDTEKLNDVEKKKRDLPVEICTLKDVEDLKDLDKYFSKVESSTPKKIGYKFAKNVIYKQDKKDKNSEDKSTKDKNSEDKSTQDKNSEDKSTKDKNSEDKSTQDKNSEDKSTKDKNSEDKSTQDKNSEDKSTKDKNSEDKRTQDKNSEDKSTQDKNSEDKSTQDSIYKNKNVIFRVKAKCDVNLELYNSTDNFDENTQLLKSYVRKNFKMMKVVIGGASNSKSWISFTNFKEVCIRTIQDTSKDNLFWISWGEMKKENQVLKIGSGNEVDLGMIVEAKLDPFKVDFVGVTTSEEHQGNWIFDNGITIYTPEEFNYKLVSPVMLEKSIKRITFKVKAKSDAHIALCHKLPNRCRENMYEIVLDEEKTRTSYIRNLSHEKKTKLVESSACSLDGDKYTTFWISWADGQIRVGKTGLYHDQILCCDYGYEYPVLYLAVSTGPKSAGYWKFDDITIFQEIKTFKINKDKDKNSKDKDKNSKDKDKNSKDKDKNSKDKDKNSKDKDSEDSKSKSKIPSDLQVTDEPRPTIWEYDYDEVKNKRVKVKWRRSQEHFSAQYIHSMSNETSINK